MESAQDLQQKQEWEECKELIRELARTDGTLVSPINLTLAAAKTVNLDRLRWLNFDREPTKMKLTNSGETAIVSGKWDPIRPYLNCGPLDANYVFSQLHFHWGSNEHEGSEHTVGGISYPLEMHVLFYKTGYLTQAAALKHDDGLVTVVYLIKLQDKSTPGLQLLTAHLDRVTEPRTSTLLPLVPLSSLLVPFTKDYILYWGTVSTSRCFHKVLWLVSRAALGISLEDLSKFRSLLDTKGERLCKNFRTTTESQGRNVFHVSPSVDNKHLLHPGTIEPPGKPIIAIVNYIHVPTVQSTKAIEIFSKGDCVEDRSKETSSSRSKSEISKPYVPSQGLSRRCSILFKSTHSNNTFNRKSPSLVSNSVKSSGSTCSRCSPNSTKAEEMLRLKSQKRTDAAIRRVIEMERKLEFEKMKLELIKRREEMTDKELTTTKIKNENNRRGVFTARKYPRINRSALKSTIPKPLGRYYRKSSQTVNKPDINQKQTTISRKSSKTLCDLCFC